MTAIALALLLLFLTCGLPIIGGEAARVARKTMTGDTVTSISATTSGSTIYDLRGRSSGIAFRVAVSAITGGTADTNYFTLTVVGSHTQGGVYAPIAGLVSGQILAATGYQLPLSTVTQPIIIPRFIKFVWTETGAITGFTATVFMDYDDDPTTAGRQVAPGTYQGG